MVARSSLLKIGGGVFAVLLVVGIAGAAVVATTFEAPTVGESSYDWGEVTDSSTQIVTSVTVNNPNPVGVPGVIDIGYTARLNDVTLAEGTRSGVGFGTGSNTIELVTEMENDKIADWWVTHVNNNESSELTIEAAVEAPGLSRSIPAKEQSIETDILGGLSSDGTETVSVRNGSFLEVSGQSATWGEADAEETPITFSSTIRNVHDYEMTLDGVEYVVTMNGVTLGNERVTQGVDVEPGQQQSLRVPVALDTPKMADWWAAHVRDDERSNLTVAMYGVVEDGGERKRVPIQLFSERLRMTTDMLGDDSTNVTNVPTDGRQAVQFPEVSDSDRQWGTVADATTDVDSTTTIDTPGENFTDLLTLDIDQQTTINDVTVASSSREVSDLSPGQAQLQNTVALDNGRVPEWWAAHLNQGERSAFRTDPSVVADVGFTKFDVDMAAQGSNFSTDLLAGMNGQRNERIEVARGRDIIFRSVESEWGRATPQRAPIEVQATVENELPTQVEISRVDYRVQINDVVLADKTARNVGTVAAGSTDTVSMTMELENQRMDEWWVSHIRNDEQSQLDVSVEVTAESRAGTVSEDVDSLGQSQQIETDILGQDDGEN